MFFQTQWVLNPTYEPELPIYEGDTLVITNEVGRQGDFFELRTQDPLIDIEWDDYLVRTQDPTITYQFTTAGDYYCRSYNGIWYDSPIQVLAGVRPPSSEKDILSMTILGQEGVIDGPIISFRFPFGTDKATLVPTITLSPLSTVAPLSDVANNFFTNLTYVVTAEDLSTKEYTIDVYVPEVAPAMSTEESNVLEDFDSIVIMPTSISNFGVGISGDFDVEKYLIEGIAVLNIGECLCDTFDIKITGLKNGNRIDLCTFKTRLGGAEAETVTLGFSVDQVTFIRAEWNIVGGEGTAVTFGLTVLVDSPVNKVQTDLG